VRPEDKADLQQIGRYKLLGKIGQGAMGEVYKAHDPSIGRFVAIKTISKGISSDKEVRERFQKEVRNAGNLNHPNIITVFDFGDEEGVIYIVMELLEGHDLRELIEKKTLTTITEKLGIMEQICDGLAFAHSKGVVHRDLKPGNIHILSSGLVKIMDFGLAKHSEDKASTSVIMGTPYYMAPEQAQGERATARSDIFSLGAVFYELLAGRRPFSGDSIPSVLFSVVHRSPESLSKWVPDAPVLVSAVEHALAKDAAERYEDAGAMREALREVRSVLFGSPEGGRPPAGLAHSPAKALPVPLSESPDADPELKEALGEIEQYLSDRLAPLMVADSVSRVMKAPPEAVAADLYTWASRQAEAQNAPLPDLVFHAVRKLHLMGEFRLVEQAELATFLAGVGEAALEYCRPEDRSRLRKSLSRLGESEMVRTGPTVVAQHPADLAVPPESEGAAPAPGASDTSTMGPGVLPANLRRLSLLEERLQREERVEAALEDDPGRSQLISQTITAAAAQAGSERELENNLRRLRAFGVASGADQIFRSLGQGLSDWILPPEVTGTTAGKAFGAEVEAMRRIISLAEEPIEMARRFRHLVYAAIEQFNEGNLGRAVQMFELAIQLHEEKAIDLGFVETVRRKGHESLDQARLRGFVEKPEYHLQLRTVLSFFSFGLGYTTLLDELQVEQRRERRRFLLDILEVHGEPSRRLAHDRLEAAAEGAEESGPHIQRNWIFLLRQIPRPADEPVEEEIELVGRFGAPGRAPLLLREVVTYLSQSKHIKAKQALVAMLHAYEAECSRSGLTTQKLQEWQAALDKICGALARFGTPTAWSAVLDHAFSRQAQFGSTMSRLAELSSQNLSGGSEVLERLFNEIGNLLPRGGVLGFLSSKKDHDLMCLIEALSGTPSEEVRAAFEDISERFPTQTIGKAAARVLEGMKAPPPPPAPDEHGALDAFGLPTLLHRLSQSRATGTLSMTEAAGGGTAAVVFDAGAIRVCRNGRLEGADAVYQLVERPLAGSYTFHAGPPAPGSTGPPMPDVASLIVEAVRRAGELQRASALVPDDAALAATGSSPSPVPDEPDYNLVVALWGKACAGVSPRQMEGDLQVDSFRIRRPLAHWLEEGALRLATSSVS
jgi:predicted Ser/Thr protein kinase